MHIAVRDRRQPTQHTVPE